MLASIKSDAAANSAGMRRRSEHGQPGKKLLDYITSDSKPRASTAHTNTVTIKATATKGKAHVS
jgi:hypothetical protein